MTYGLGTDCGAAGPAYSAPSAPTIKPPASQPVPPSDAIPQKQVEPAGQIALASLPEHQGTVDEDQIYAAIGNELETNTTDKGLWTRLFAQCNGDENQTKAQYIKERATKLIAAENLKIAEHARIVAECESARKYLHARGQNVATVNAGDTAAMKEIIQLAAKLKTELIARDAEEQRQRALKDSLNVEALELVKKFESGASLKSEEVNLLVNAANVCRPLVQMKDTNDGYTLLHWCAVLGLDQLAEVLLRLGADAAAKDCNGKQAHQLSRGTALAMMLESAARSPASHA